ncbi:MAG: DUF1566 domain-containing protein [bacterium]|nr:DUF1566 domain-containing protein [bacterium]
MNRENKYFLFNILLFTLMLSRIAISQQTDKPSSDTALSRVAVVDFEAIGSGVDREFGKGVAEILSSALIKSKKYRVIERSALLKVLKEQKLQMTDLVDTKSAVEVGKFLGAETIVTGSIIKMGKSYTLTPRFIDVQTATAKESENLTCTNEEEIPRMCNQIVEILIGERLKPKSVTYQKAGDLEFVDQSADGRFKVTREGIILDTRTDLMWAPDPGGDRTWYQAKEYAENLTLGGYTDWRLPTRAELKGLYEPSKEHKPYGHEDWGSTIKIDPVFKFSGYWAWSSELYESEGSSGAWLLDFDDGYEDWIDRDDSDGDRVLPVRSRR